LIVVRYLKCWGPHINMKMSKGIMSLKNLFFKVK
jgi:hypothetical protein